jgi:photosystem II stability/assembly factor-like uncharacterized protein
MHYLLLAVALLTTPVFAATWTLTEVDSSPYTGAENAIYAPDLDTVYIAYKQFLEPPSSDYTPAAVKLAQSMDGGQSWQLSLIDLDAPQSGDTLEQSVSIGGSHDTFYVAYYVQPSGLFASHQLRVAKSSDAGATWEISTLVNGFGGGFNAIKVVDEDTVYISYSGEGSASGLYIAQTHDGGGTWSLRLIEAGQGNGWYSSVDAVDADTVFASYYNGLYPDHLDLNFAGSMDALGTVTLVNVEHPSSGFVGLGSAISAVDSNTIYITYELFSGGSRVKLAASFDGGMTWRRTFVEPDFGGVNTAVKAFASGVIYSSYWTYPPSGAKLAKSEDQGSTWTLMPIPEPGAIEIFLDLAVPQEGRAYVSYATTDRRLKLATFSEWAPTGVDQVAPRDSSRRDLPQVRRHTAFVP